MSTKKPTSKPRQTSKTTKKLQRRPWLSAYQKLNHKRGLVFVISFALVGIISLFIANAYSYNPYNPASESGQATWYSNYKVGGPGHCAAVHYSRGKTIQVRNVANGRTLTCLVSDAGPFGYNRIVDLNPTDFSSISQYGTGQGVLNVVVSLVGSNPPAPPTGGIPAPAPSPPPPSGNLYSCPSHSTLQQGSANTPCVKYLQWFLVNKFGYGSIINPAGGIDGGFGPATKRAVQQFQFDHHVPNSSCGTAASSCDGVVGPTTWRYLEQ